MLFIDTSRFDRVLFRPTDEECSQMRRCASDSSEADR